jgi:glycosyltransferase involved in cell wall biosynthesis
MTMVVGFDCFPLRRFASGTEEYAEGLIRALLNRGVPLAALGGRPFDPRQPRLGQPLRDKPNPVEKWRWETAGILAAARWSPVNLVHIPYLGHPGRAFPCPSVVTVHDVIPFTFPGYQARLRDRLYFRNLPARLSHATRLVAVSEATRDAALSVFPDWATKLRVIPNGVHDAYFEPPLPSALESLRNLLPALDDPGERRILYVGNYQPHKNVPTLLQAVAGLSSDLKPRLLLVGSRDDLTLQKDVMKLHLSGRVSFLPHLERPLLRALYQFADVFAFPSRMEGFGLPPAQALAAGVPAAVSTAAAVREVVGDAALKADPDDIPAWTANLTELLVQEPEARIRQIERGRARAESFRWSTVAAQYQALYEEVAGA